MEKEESILTVQCRLSDRDFEDVFRIYTENERNRDKRFGLLTCGILCALCIFLMILLKSMTFIIYAIGALIIGLSYFLVPVNKKFLATNKLMFGEWRRISFYQHALTTMEIFDKNEAAVMDEEEIEEATTRISTNSMVAYENERGFLFADGKIVNQFVYVPKRGLTRTEITAIQDFAQNNCSGGYELLEASTLLDEEEKSKPAVEEDEDTSETSDICNQYYGAKRLKIYDSEGHRIHTDKDEDAESEDAFPEEDDDDAHTEIMEAPEMDIEEAMKHIIAEDQKDDT